MMELTVKYCIKVENSLVKEKVWNVAKELLIYLVFQEHV